MADANLANWQSAVDNGFSFGKNAYLEAIPDLATASATAKGVTGLQSGAAAEQAKLAKSLSDRTATFNGMQDKYSADAFGMNSPARQAQVSSQASADVASKYAGMRSQGLRQLARTGVNPSSGKSMALNSQMDISEATAKAGAANKARQDLEVVANDRQKTAIGFGANLPAQATSAAQAAGTLGNQVVASAQAPLAQRLAFAGGISGLYGTAEDGYKGLWQSQNLTPAQQASISASEQAQSNAQNAAFISALGSVAGSSGGSALIDKGVNYLAGLF